MSATSLPRILTLLALAAMVATAAPAQDGGEEADAGPAFDIGFTFGAEVWGAELQGFGLGLARLAPVQSAADDNGDNIIDLDEAVRGSGGLLGLDDLDVEALLRIEAGVTWARADDSDPHRNRLVLRGLVYDPSGESVAASSSLPVNVGNGDTILVGGILPLLGTSLQVLDQGSGRPEGGNLPYRVTGSVDVESTSIDLVWTRRVDLIRGWEMEWSAGLRWLEFDVSAAAVFESDAADVLIPPAAGEDVTSTETATYSSETSGIGPLVGVRIGYRFGEARRLGLHGGLELAGLHGDADWSYRSTQNYFNAQFPPPQDRVLTELNDDGSDRTITTWEWDLGLSWRFNEMAELRGGVRGSNWEDAWTKLSLLDEGSPNQESIRSSQESAELQGAYVGIRLDF